MGLLRFCVTVVLVMSFDSGFLSAQQVIFVCDSTEDIVVRMVDDDGDGLIDSATEASVYFDDASPAADLSVPTHLLHTDAGLLLLDGGTLDSVFLLVDDNGDGDANDSGEASVYYDNEGEGPDLSTPNGLAEGPSGKIYVADDGSTAQAIICLQDQNGDGDATDLDEAWVFYDDSSASELDPISDPESVAVDADERVYVGDTSSGTVYWLQDLDDDGDALGADEIGIFYDDTGPFTLTDVDALAIDEDGVVFAVNEDDGTVVRLEDSNGDGDALDEDEATVFLEDSVVDDPNDAVLLPGGALLLADGGLDGIAVAEDLDADGSASGEGEVTVILEDGTLFSTPSGIAVVGTPDDVELTTEFLRGDVNGDGYWGIIDGIEVLEYVYLGREQTCLDVMDFDDDNTVTATDGLAILTFAFLSGDEPAAPYPDIGVDPTPDGPGCDVW